MPLLYFLLKKKFDNARIQLYCGEIIQSKPKINKKGRYARAVNSYAVLIEFTENLQAEFSLFNFASSRSEIFTELNTLSSSSFYRIQAKFKHSMSS